MSRYLDTEKANISLKINNQFEVLAKCDFLFYESKDLEIVNYDTVKGIPEDDDRIELLRLLEIETSQPDLESIEKQLIEETQPDKEYLPIDVSERVRKDVFWNGNIICDYGGCNIGWKSIVDLL